MTNRSYPREIADIIDAFLTGGDWKYRFDEDKGIFELNMTIPDRAKVLNFHILVTDVGFTSLARYPLGPDCNNDEEMNTMTRFLTRANYGLRVGNFEMDLEDGEIRYKVHCSCKGTLPTEEMVEESILCSVAMFRKYGPGILDILFKGVSDKEAIRTCEGGTSGLVAELLARLARKKAEEAAEAEEEPQVHVSFEDFLRRMAEQAADKAGEDPEDFPLIDE